MGDFLNFVTPFFATPRNYADVLKRIAGFTVYEIYFITLFLRDIPSVGSTFRSIETYHSLGALIAVLPHSESLNIAGLAIAIFVAAITHVTQLHEQISNLFGIRLKFDVEEILKPLAKRVGSTLSPAQTTLLTADKDRLMRQVFYKYASSTRENGIVDRHDIEAALSAWSWYWAALDGVIYSFIGSLVAFALCDWRLGSSFVAVAAIILGASALQHRRLRRYVVPQIDAIAEDVKASAEVKDVFNAL